jgi:hypothetical protein
MYRLPLALLVGAIAYTPLSAFAEDKPATNTQAPDKKDVTSPQAPGATVTQTPEKKTGTGAEPNDKKPARKKVGGCD